ncbi:MAG TPA: ThiF family adenylyltransferase [Thermoleophilaceae bacterium]|nr:ThiF family adenylyltransferase [Thermoleophilaceae bacterium]
MPERIVLVGLGGIGSQLLPSLVRYLAFRPEPRPLLVLVDGDAYEPGNRTRQVFPETAIGTNKAEALAKVYRGLTVQAVADYLTEANVAEIIRDGDAVLLAVDNHWSRFLIDRHLAGLEEVTLISGGNDETDGNVQLVRRRDGQFVDGSLAEIHVEIGRATEAEFAARNGCERQVEERPQLVATNLMVASAMLNCLWAVLERGSVSYSEVYLDVIANAMRSRSWFRQRQPAA